MNSLKDYQQQLNRYVEAHIPSIQHAGARLFHYDDDALVIKAPLSLNQNDHGDAFGGSLYNLALFAGWAALYFECSKTIAKPHIVTRDAQMRYRHPINDNEILAHCRLPSARQWDGFFAHFEKTGKTTISLSTIIKNQSIEAARLEAVYVLLAD